MPKRAYQASGQSNPLAVPLLAAVCLGAAVASGVVEGLVSRWFSLILLFPALLGGIVGFAAMRVVERAHVRAPLLAAFLAGVAGFGAQLTEYGTQYVQFRMDMRDQFAAQSSESSEQVIDRLLEQETGRRGFVGYLFIRSRVGTEIKKAGQSSGIKLAGTGFWILLAINFLIAGGIAAGMAWGRAQKPYCEPCQRWYDRTEPVGSGSGDKSAVAATRQALDRGAFGEVPAALGVPREGSVSVLQLLRCSNCSGHEPQLSYVVVTGKKQETKNAYKSMLRSEEARRLLEAFDAKKPAAT